MKLVLASGSPRRRAVLRALVESFEVDPANIDERRPQPGEDPDAYARELALEKLKATASRHPDAIVLAADTVVYRDGRVLGKPKSDSDALDMLSFLAGGRHQIITAVAVSCGEHHVSSMRSTVHFADISIAGLQSYVASGEGRDKAGAYAIQGGAGAFISGVEGCLENIIGLPLCVVANLLEGCDLLLLHVPAPCTHFALERGWSPHLATYRMS